MTDQPMTFARTPLNRLLLTAGLLAGGLVQAQPAPLTSLPANRASSLGWQVCQAMKDDATGQLACFQQWAESQLPANTPPAAMTTVPADPATGAPATQILLLPSLNTEAPDGKPIGCRNTRYSELSRFWELQRGTDCDTFAIRGYRPITMSLIMSGGVESPASTDTASTMSPLPCIKKAKRWR